MIRFKIIFVIFILIIGINSCKKTYDDGPTISFRSKFNRITGKWKLKSIEGVPRLSPELEQYMELTKDNIDGNRYKAIFSNFQEEFCNDDTSGEKLFSNNGYWEFYSGDFWEGCNISEELEKNEGLRLTIEDNGNIYWQNWKILRLTNKELIIKNNVCSWAVCYYNNSRTLTFEKEK